jgi:hypothetical protein
MTARALASALWLPFLFVVSAAWIAVRERATYRAHRGDPEPEAVFVYDRRRLRRRLIGTVVLAAIGLTLAGWELAVVRELVVDRAARRAVAALLAAALGTELAALIGIAVGDLIETARRRG